MFITDIHVMNFYFFEYLDRGWKGLDFLEYLKVSVNGVAMVC